MFSFLIISGCQSTLTATLSTNQTEIPPTTPVDITVVDNTPTVTPMPLPAAAIVNGERISLADFEEEYLRYQDAAALNSENVDEQTGRAIVLENLIDLYLLAQSARESGFLLTDELFQQRLNELTIALGSPDKLEAWLMANHYNRDSFERLFQLEIEAAEKRDMILAEVPTVGEQIHARQIMVQGKQLAEEIYNQLEAGADFATLSWIYDPLTGGELSWFPRDYLVIPEIGKAVFALQPGEYTEIIPTDYGYQIVQVIEKEMERPLTQDALLTYQRKALAEWIQNAKSNAQLEIISQ